MSEPRSKVDVIIAGNRLFDSSVYLPYQEYPFLSVEAKAESKRVTFACLINIEKGDARIIF